MTAPVNIPHWPALLDKAMAARYCSLSQAAFEREVATGRLPMPVIIGDRERWHRRAIDDSLDAILIGGDWRSKSALYAE